MNNNFFRQGRKIYTKNLLPGRKVYGEQLDKIGNIEYRQWDIRRSKLAAAIAKGLKDIIIKEGDTVLYLGASSGTTPSHISDLVGEKGFVFAVDFAPRVVRELVFLCEQRKNMTPILADASDIDELAKKVTMADVIYQDIAQREQAKIFLDNVEMFLKQDGIAFLALKARSINVAEQPQKLFNKVREELKPRVIIIEQINLEPFEKDHCMFVVKKK